MAEESSLVLFNRARVALAQARSIDEVKDVRDKTVALRLYVKQQGASLEMQNDIAEITIRAERRAGEILAEMDPNPGTRGQLSGRDSSGSNIVLPPESDLPTLSDLGIGRMQSSRWQAIARMPERAFEQHIAVAKAEGRELTSRGTLQAARRMERPAGAETPTFPTGRFRCLVIDPPWPVQKSEREERPMQGQALDYPTMSLDDIARLPIPDLADDGCHLYLWTTQKLLPSALGLVTHWDFDYQCLLTWVKPTGMTPFSWMYNTEHVIFAHRGGLRLQRLGLKLSFDASVVRHSEKPEVFYERVLLASPGPRLELFSRREREGFTAWGNEVGSIGIRD